MVSHDAEKQSSRIRTLGFPTTFHDDQISIIPDFLYPKHLPFNLSNRSHVTYAPQST
jgi:hypothetical protein